MSVSCADSGPVLCFEPGCPGLVVTCPDLRSACHWDFDDVWDLPIPGFDSLPIWLYCPQTCQVCDDALCTSRSTSSLSCQLLSLLSGRPASLEALIPLLEDVEERPAHVRRMFAHYVDAVAVARGRFQLLQYAMERQLINIVRISANASCAEGVADDEIAHAFERMTRWFPCSLLRGYGTTRHGGMFWFDMNGGRIDEYQGHVPTKLAPAASLRLERLITLHRSNSSPSGSAARLDATCRSFVGPFVQSLARCAGDRTRVDVTEPLGLELASIGAADELRLLLDCGYRIDRRGTPWLTGTVLHSVAHAAALTGHAEVLELLQATSGLAEAIDPVSGYTATQFLAQGQLVAPEVEPLRHQQEVEVSDLEADNGGWGAHEVPSPTAYREHGSACQVLSHADVIARPSHFLRSYVLGNRPVVVRDVLRHDPKLRRLRDLWRRENLLDTHGESIWSVAAIAYQDFYMGNMSAVNQSSLAEFVHGPLASGSHAKIVETRYRRDGRVQRVNAEWTLSLDWLIDHCPTDELSAFPSKAIREGRLSSPSQFYLGGPRSGTPVHYHQPAVNLLAFGHRLWKFVPPRLASWDYATTMHEQMHQQGPTASVTCRQRAGDMVFVPFGWGHGTYNLQTSIGLAQSWAIWGS